MRRFHDQKNLFDVADDLAGSGSLNLWSRLGLGILLPPIVGVVGLFGILRQSITFIQMRPIHFVQYEGVEAFALGVAYLAVALFLFCHFFVMTIESLYGYGEVGKLVSVVLFLGGVGAFAYRALVFS